MGDYKPKDLPCLLGVFQLSEQDWASLATQYPNYVGQSINLPSRLRTYVESGIDFRKHKNCLDRVSLKGNRIFIRLLDYAIADSDSLDASERCQIAIWKPNLNKIDYGYDLSYCSMPIKRKRAFKKQSGIYQLIVVPLKIVNQIPMKQVASRDVVKTFQIEFLANPSRLKGYTPLKKLKFYDFA